jgi:hypothetical protein
LRNIARLRLSAFCVTSYRERADTLLKMAELKMAESARHCFQDFEIIDPDAFNERLRPAVLEPLKDVRRRYESLRNWRASTIDTAVRTAIEQRPANAPAQ